MIKLEFGFNSPGLNTKLKHYQRVQLRAKIYEAVASAIWDLGKIERYPKARITYTRFSKQPMDRDNLYSSAKFWIDAIKRWGIIPDDSELYLDLVCQNGKGSAGTKIEIVPLAQ